MTSSVKFLGAAKVVKRSMSCEDHGTDGCTCALVAEPRLARFLFADLRFAWVWLVLRLWLGWQWIEAGRHKLSDPGWMDSGLAVKGFWERAIAMPESGRPLIAYDWYRSFLTVLLEGGHYTWLAKIVVWGELAVGAALILGVLVGLAAFSGLFMNWHYVMAGAASTNAMLAFVGMFLILAWRTAGWIGLDRWLLPRLGVRRTASPTSAGLKGQAS